MITNVLQTSTYETPNRAWFAQCKGVDAANYREIALAVLPLSHTYGLTVISTMSAYRGDTALVLPKFELRTRTWERFILSSSESEERGLTPGPLFCTVHYYGYTETCSAE